jgi:hypothetical protein
MVQSQEIALFREDMNEIVMNYYRMASLAGGPDHLNDFLESKVAKTQG